MRLLEDALGGDFGGADGRFEAGRFADEHAGFLLLTAYCYSMGLGIWLLVTSTSWTRRWMVGFRA